MQPLNKRDLIFNLIGMLIGAALIWALYPPMESKVEYKDRIVVQEKVVTRIIEKKAPDGSSETITEIIDESKKEQDTSLLVSKIAKKQYVVGVHASTEYSWNVKPEYSVSVARRLVGPVFGSVTASSERVAVGVLYEF